MKPLRVHRQKQAASILGVSLRHLQRLDNLGIGPAKTQLGDRLVGYTDHALSAWVAQRTMPREVDTEVKAPADAEVEPYEPNVPLGARYRLQRQRSGKGEPPDLADSR